MAETRTKSPKTKTSKTASAQAARPRPKTSATACAPITHEMIAQRAREIWERKGRPHGKCEENWLEAEAELRSACKAADVPQ